MLPKINKLTRTASISLAILLLISTNIHFNQTHTLYNLPSIKKVQAQGLDPACIGPTVASYMDAVIEGAGGLPHIKLLSPAFNLTAGTISSNLIQSIRNSSSRWGELNGIAGNAYNVNGKTIIQYVDEHRWLFDGKPIYLTEMGAFSNDNAAVLALADQVQNYINPDFQIQAAALFDAFGDNPGFPFHILSDSQIQTICNGSCADDKVGVNSAVWFKGVNDAFYGRAQSPHQMRWTVEIANNDSDPTLPQVLPGIQNAHSKGITPIIRIGVQNSSGGFDNPQDYVNFLTIISNKVSQDVFAIAGPNEPMTECWASPECGCSSTIENIPCDRVSSVENHPLRPYPGSPCGNIDSPEVTYCAMRPWVGASIPYLKNRNQCTPGDGICIAEDLFGSLSINTNETELPLVSVTREGFNYLTFFNRSQEHHADYLEGRAHYDIYSEPDITDGDNDIADRASIWNRLGIFRKLLPLSLQNKMKISNIQSVGTLIHNYIVSPGFFHNQGCDIYNPGCDIYSPPAETPVRMTDFIGNYPPVYQCGYLTDPIENENCKLEFFDEMEEWRESIWGQLWPRVPMVSREDAIGHLSVFPEPGQPFTQAESSTQLSIPHLPRLDAVSTRLQEMLQPIFTGNTQTTAQNLNYSPAPQFAGLFPECEAVISNNVDFNLFTPQTMINNKAG